MQLYMLSWKPNDFMTDQISLLHEAEDLTDGINFYAQIARRIYRRRPCLCI